RVGPRGCPHRRLQTAFQGGVVDRLVGEAPDRPRGRHGLPDVAGGSRDPGSLQASLPEENLVRAPQRMQSGARWTLVVGVIRIGLTEPSRRLVLAVCVVPV